MLELNRLYNMDCMDGMKEFPDKYFDLAIVDPPYGHEIEGKTKITRTGGTWSNKYKDGDINKWDKQPTKDYFDELFRVSQNQIIWGGNYFELPPTRCFIVWNKTNITENFTIAMCEYAWTSFNKNAKLYSSVSNGTIKDKRIHPTQKPVSLYSFILNHFANPRYKILDTHAGSASSLIACYRNRLDYIGFEIDKDYFDLATNRLDNEMSQIRIDLF
jgi:site-specific DNA-methyltransferase (adenine-specific)